MTMIRPRSDVVYGICRGLPNVLLLLSHFVRAQLFNPETDRLGAGDATAIIIPRIHFYNVFSVTDFVNVLLFLCLHLSMGLTVNTKLANPRYKQK